MNASNIEKQGSDYHPEEQIKNINVEEENIFLGFYALDIGALIALMTSASVDVALTIALYCFATAFPVLSVLIFIKRSERALRRPFVSIGIPVMYLLGCVCPSAGICAVFFSFFSWDRLGVYCLLCFSLYIFSLFVKWRGYKPVELP